MNRETYTATYRALRSKARRAQASRPENIHGVSIARDGVLFFDTNWPESDPEGRLGPRTVTRITPPEDRNRHTPRTAAMVLFALLLPTKPKHQRRLWIDQARRCPPIPLPR